MSGLTVKIFINDKRGGRIATLAEVVRSNKKTFWARLYQLDGSVIKRKRRRDVAEF
jgi:hypothetical protein